MKISASVLAFCLSVLLGGTVAQGQALTPVPETPGVPISGMSTSQVYELHAAPAIPLFTKVKYEDLDDMAPCAQPKIVLVRNPCTDPCRGCPADLVAIQICVPTSCCELVSCRRNGDRIRYDYGEYQVDIKIKKGYIEVEYED